MQRASSASRVQGLWHRECVSKRGTVSNSRPLPEAAGDQRACQNRKDRKLPRSENLELSPTSHGTYCYNLSPTPPILPTKWCVYFSVRTLARLTSFVRIEAHPSSRSAHV